MPDEPDNDEPRYRKVMPFVACQSEGGVYDDMAFSVGFMLGTLDVQLRLTAALHFQWGAPTAIPDPALAQADLIAMKHDWFMHRLPPDLIPGEELAPGWTWVTFSHDPNTQGEAH